MEDLPRELPLLRIMDVSRLTGVSAANLRAWEKRHGFPVPDRTSGGQRLYTRAQVEDLERVRDLVAGGLRVGEAVNLLRADEPEGAPAGDPVRIADRLLGALLVVDADEADRVLAEATALLPLDQVVTEVVEPVLRRIGDGWAAGLIGVDQEHAATEVVRGWVAAAGRIAGRGPRRERLLAACVEGERHDQGLALIGLLLRRAGYEVIALGADVPTAAILAAVGRHSPQGVLLSATLDERLGALERVVEALAALPAEGRPRVAAGGYALSGWRETTAMDGAAWLGPDARSALAAAPGWLHRTPAPVEPRR